MGNTQGFWILEGVSFTLNFLNLKFKKIAAEKYWTMETEKLNKPIYLKNILISEWKSENMLL